SGSPVWSSDITTLWPSLQVSVTCVLLTRSAASPRRRPGPTWRMLTRRALLASLRLNERVARLAQGVGGRRAAHTQAYVEFCACRVAGSTPAKVRKSTILNPDPGFWSVGVHVGC